MNSLVASFGKFVKFYVSENSASQSGLPSATGEQPNVFRILMASQAHKSTQTLPPCVVEQRNKKDELYNAVIGFFQAENLRWTSSEVDIGIAPSTVKHSQIRIGM